MNYLLILISTFFFQFEDPNFLNSESTEALEANQIAPLVTNKLYEGTLNETIKIWLYLNVQESPCGGNMTIVNAMYKYESQDKWLLLNPTHDASKKKYCLVEDLFTGVLFLEENETGFQGHWISPDIKKQYKVVLKKVTLDGNTNEKLEEILFDDLLYNKNDC